MATLTVLTQETLLLVEQTALQSLGLILRPKYGPWRMILEPTFLAPGSKYKPTLKVCGSYIQFVYHVLQLLHIRFTHVLHQQIHNEASTKKSRPPMILVWSSEVHVYSFLNWIHVSSQLLCSLLSVKDIIKYRGIVQSHLSMYVYGICSLILTLSLTNQT
jgi:hypothetical protein